MTFLLILLIIIIVGLMGFDVWFQIKQDMRPRSTPEATITYLAQILERSAETGSILNISSGYGRAVFQLAKRLPTWQVIGIERNASAWIIANLRSIGKNYGNYRFFLEDPMLRPFRDYNVIFLSQEQKILKKWEATIARHLQPGTLFISYNAQLPRIKPLEVLTVSPTSKLYVYRKPAAAATTQTTLPIEEPVVPQAQPLPEVEPVSSPVSNDTNETPTAQPL